MRFSALLALGLVLVAPGLHAQGTHLLRQPNASASAVTFVHGGDVWIAPREGGIARRLTTFPGTESYPRFSPDGKSIAFTGEYGGNEDVYVVPVEGGEPVRLTWHPGNDEVRGWSPDGSHVIFSSGRTSAPLNIPKMWSVARTGGPATPLPLPEVNRGTYSPDGTHFVYQRTSPWDVEWRNYRGGQAQAIRIADLKTLAVESLPWQGSGDTDPVWLGSTIYFLSDRDYAVNLYSYDVAAKSVKQLTHYREFDAKQLSAGGGVLTYELGGLVHMYDPATGNDRQLDITANGDLPWTRSHYEDVAKRLDHPSLSPTGARAAFEARGEIVTVPAEKGDWRNLSASPGAADRRPIWSPDGKSVAWFSDASGEYKLVIRSQDGVSAQREITLPKPTFYFTPVWSPDGKRIAYTDTGLNVWILDVAAGTAKLIDTDQYMVPSRTVDPAWSPDGRWLAYSKRLDSQYHAVFVYSVADAKVHQVTDGLSDALNPAWDASGKYLYFLASTNFGLNSGWLDMSSYEHPVQRAVYLAVLRADEKSPLLPESDDEKGKPDTTTAKPVPDSTKAKGKAASAAAVKSAVTADTTRVRIDFDGMQQRILALGVPSRDYSALTAGANGILFFAEEIPNQPGLTLHRYELTKRAAKPYLAGITQFAVSADGKKLLYGSVAGDWGIVGTDAAPKVGDGKINTAIKVLADPAVEWRQIYNEAWRFERDFFYVPNLHGADWPAVRQRYTPWLADVAHRSDLTYMLDILGGELSVGHSFVFGGDTPAIDTVKIGMLGADLSVENGALRITRIFNGENWNPGLRAPLSSPGVTVREGDYILAVNGVPVLVDGDPYRAFEATAERQTVLTLNDKPTMTGSRTVTIVPVGNEAPLRSRAWVEDNRRLVDKRSGGTLAYVWLPNTAEAGYTYFNRYYFAQQDKQGVILDERYNGGGSLADYFIDVLSRTLTGYFNNPVGDRRPFTAPQAGIWGPKVMLINEYAGSGGDALPFMFHQRKLGTLVGHKTWGGLVGIWDAPPLMDGGAITAPRGGFFNLDGQWDVENKGIAPDIDIDQTPKDIAEGHDVQLLRAVDEALRQIKEHPFKRLTEPAPPKTVRRPAP